VFKTARRISLSVVAFATIGMGLGVLSPTAALADAEPRDPVAMEQDFVARVNQLRATQGLKPYIVDGETRSVAMAWTEKMAAVNAISHNPDLGKQVTASWVKLGENVGYGGDVASVEDAFEASPGHRKNLLDPTFTAMSVTIVLKGPALYVTQQFRQPDELAKSGPVIPAAPNELALASAPRVSVKSAQVTRAAGPKVPKSTQAKRPAKVERAIKLSVHRRRTVAGPVFSVTGTPTALPASSTDQIRPYRV
jgi:Cysteine-rich secretory protein family